MSNRARVGLDNPTFTGRLRRPVERPQPRVVRGPMAMDSLRPEDEAAQVVQAKLQPQSAAAPQPVHNPQEVFARKFETEQAEQGDVRAVPEEAPPINVIPPEPFVAPSKAKQQPSAVLKRQFVKPPSFATIEPAVKRHHAKMQLAMMSMAVLVFGFGLAVSISTLQTNNKAASTVSALSQEVDKQATTSDVTDPSAPSVTKPAANSYANYMVAPDLARYIKIPKLGVDARVLQVGVKANGEMATPNNVHDAAWYNGSAKPGQAGATLIDGHVSSWTSRGVFYGVKTLAAGDAVQIVKGDGAIINYKVVKTQTYDAGNVDMQAAMKPVTEGKSGLNLITCAGQVKKGTNDFSQRVIVFAEQV